MPRESKIPFQKNEVESSVIERFEKIVDNNNHKLAVKSKDQSLRYSDLNEQANRVARAILAVDSPESETVALMFDHNVPAVVAILGILKAGKAYVPLDSSFPTQRLNYMVEDSGANLVLTNNQTISLANDLFDKSQKILNIDNIKTTESSENLGVMISPETNAYIMYSSGSTGKPKGIAQNHRNLLHHVWDHTTTYQFSEDEKHALILSFSFAASISEIFSPLLNGGTLCLYNVKKGGLIELAAWLKEEEITVLKIPISLFRIFVSTLKGSSQFPKLRLVLLGGDTLFRRDVVNFRQRFSSNCILVNRLTSTESNSVTQYIITPMMKLTDRIIPVGYPALNKDIKLVDEEGKLVTTNDIGEIVISSRFITPGYWNKPELSKQKFRKSDENDDMMVFHTGDLGRFKPDGCLEHIGRTDFMVKIRGFRVDIAEITAALLELPFIEDAVVIASPDSRGEKQLVGYIVPVGGSEKEINTLRNLLSEDLPDYMIPTEFVVLDQLPKTPTGKIDYQKLPEVETNIEKESKTSRSSRSSLERQILHTWELILDKKGISLQDDFFDLGGNSLDALRTVAGIEEAFGIQLPLHTFLQARTIEKLAKILEEKGSQKFKYLISLESGGSKIPFFCLPPSGTTVMTFGKLAQHMGHERPFYGLEYAGMDGKNPPHFSIPEMAKTYIGEIRKIQSDGPYYLGGMCFGGLVAYEIAQHLLADGKEVGFLGILDTTHAPNLSNPKGFYIFMVTRWLNRKLLRGKFTMGATLMTIPDEDIFRKQIQHVFSSHNYARMIYRATPYQGRITLFNTVGKKGQFAKKQWMPIAQGGLKVIIIPGIHHGHTFGFEQVGDTFIREPHVKVLAEKLSNCLDEADGEIK